MTVYGLIHWKQDAANDLQTLKSYSYTGNTSSDKQLWPKAFFYYIFFLNKCDVLCLFACQLVATEYVIDRLLAGSHRCTCSSF